MVCFFFSSRRRHTRSYGDWSSDVCSSDLEGAIAGLVNLRTAMPFDYKGFKGVLGATETYSTLLKGAPSPSGTLLLSNRWNTQFGEFGALVDFAHTKSPTRSDGVGVDPYFPHVNSTD